MHESRENRNSACFVGDYAYVAGGKNSKAHKFSYKDQKWESIQDYPISDTLNSWTSAKSDEFNMQKIKLGHSEDSAKRIATILQESEEDGTFEEATEWQHVDLKELERQLFRIESIKEEIEFL